MATPDGHNPPLQVRASVSESEDMPIFGSNGDLYLLGREHDSSYLYRLNPDGAAAVKVIEDTIIEPQSVSPDGKWVVAQVAFSGKEAPRGVVAYPTDGGPPMRICRIYCFVSWSMNGQFMYVHLPGTSKMNELGKTFIMPVQTSNPFSQLPKDGLSSEADFETTTGLNTIEGAVSPGPSRSLYAFTRQNVHRNLYRIPIH